MGIFDKIIGKNAAKKTEQELEPQQSDEAIGKALQTSAAESTFEDLAKEYDNIINELLEQEEELKEKLAKIDPENEELYDEMFEQFKKEQREIDKRKKGYENKKDIITTYKEEMVDMAIDKDVDLSEEKNVTYIVEAMKKRDKFIEDAIDEALRQVPKTKADDPRKSRDIIKEQLIEFMRLKKKVDWEEERDALVDKGKRIYQSLKTGQKYHI